MVNWASQYAQGMAWVKVQDSGGNKGGTRVSILLPMGVTSVLSLIYHLGGSFLPGEQQWTADFPGGMG